MGIDVETIDKLQNLARPETCEITQYGKYSERTVEAVYSDNRCEYSVHSVKGDTMEVHSKKAFVEFITKELERRKNEDGDLATLIIGVSGGKFVADDNFQEGICTYNRIISQQWQMLRKINGQILGHEEFLMSILALSPSVADFKEVYKKFLTLRIVGKSELTSNPVFVNNQAESGYLVKYKLEGQNSDVVVPDGFYVSVPFVKAGQKKYGVNVDVQVLNSSSNELRMKINIPELDYIEETAIIDEIEEIKAETKKYDKMLILSDI